MVLSFVVFYDIWGNETTLMDTFAGTLWLSLSSFQNSGKNALNRLPEDSIHLSLNSTPDNAFESWVFYGCSLKLIGQWLSATRKQYRATQVSNLKSRVTLHRGCKIWKLLDIAWSDGIWVRGRFHLLILQNCCTCTNGASWLVYY